MPSSHLSLCRPLLLLPPVPPSIRVFSNESTLRMRWPKYWSFSFSIIPSKEIPGLISSEWTGWISLQSKGLSRVFSNTTVQEHQFFSASLHLAQNNISSSGWATVYCDPHSHLILCCPLLLLPSIFPSIRVFPMSQFFASGGQSIGVSVSTSVFPMNIQD